MECILYQKLAYWARRKLNAKNLASGYKKFWHKVDGRRQFYYKARNGENITLALYRKIAKRYSDGIKFRLTYRIFDKART